MQHNCLIGQWNIMSTQLAIVLSGDCKHKRRNGYCTMWKKLSFYSFHCLNNIIKPWIGGLTCSLWQKIEREKIRIASVGDQREQLADTIDVRCSFDQAMRHDRREFINPQSALLPTGANATSAPSHIPAVTKSWATHTPPDRTRSRSTVKSATAAAAKRRGSTGQRWGTTRTSWSKAILTSLNHATWPPWYSACYLPLLYVAYYVLSRNLIFLYFPRHRCLVLRPPTRASAESGDLMWSTRPSRPSCSLRPALPYLRRHRCVATNLFHFTVHSSLKCSCSSSSSTSLLAFLPVTLWILSPLVKYNAMEKIF